MAPPSTTSVFDVTPASAWRFFAIALVSGTAGALVHWSLPPVAVAAYGGLLVISQTRRYTYLNPTLKDSPYFLGFILTLAGLILAFLKVAKDPDLVARTPGPLIADLAAAIAATGVGLFLRQWLLTLDPADNARDAVATSILDELRENAVAFQNSQLALKRLVDEFVQERQSLFDEELAATRHYIARLHEGGGTLGRLQAHYPTEVERLVKAVAAATDQIISDTQSQRARLAELRDAFEQGLLAEQAEYRKATAANLEGVREVREQLHGQLAALGESFGHATRALEAQAGRLEALVARHPEAAQRVASATDGIATAVGGVQQRLDAISLHLQDVATALTKVPDDLRSIGEEGARASQALHERVRALAADADQINGTMDQLISVLQDRLSELNRVA